MKKNWKNNLTTPLLALIVFLVTACGQHEKHESHNDTYTCPMHPTVISDKPGICPVCGMDLVRQARPGEEVGITGDLAQLIKSPDQVVKASVTTIKGEFKKMNISIEGEGVITYDTRNIYTISSRVSGRLDKVYLKYAFQPITKGQRIAEIYSPELITAQKELLFLSDHDTNNTTLIAAARERLRLLGATEKQIDDLLHKKNIQNTFTLYSPYDGYVISMSEPTPTAPLPASASMNSMNRSPDASTNRNSVVSGEAPLIREGSYVSIGEPLFRVVQTEQLRVELSMPASQAALIRQGDPVNLDFGNGKLRSTTIDFVQPFFSQGKEFLTLRIYIKSSPDFHIGQLVKASLVKDSVEALWIPKTAVLDLGSESIVFIKERDVLKPKAVVTGARSAEATAVVKGLSSSDEIATHAQYLIDSESFIKTSNQK
jgi:multidrug efflux pump subunit AcrA (membrane-fusion protein)